MLSEDLVAWFVELSPDPTVIVDGDGRIAHLNTQAEALFGYAREELLTHSIEMLVPERFALGHEPLRRGYLSDPHARPMGAGLELAARRKDGSEFPVDIALSPLATDQGVFAVAAIRDITEQKRAEQERSALKMQQSLRLESLGRLAGGVAHDFNNLTAVIQNYADFVREAIDEHRSACGNEIGLDTVDDDLDTIRGAAGRAAGLTRQLLIFGQREVTIPVVLQLNDVIRSLENLLRRSVGEHVTVSLNLDADLSSVMADEAMMEQIVVNLALNARDAIQENGTLTFETHDVTVEPHAEAIDGLQPGPYVQLAVIDDGSGMAPEIVARAFEPFFTTKSQGEGTGLGLTTVFAIATQHGGEVLILSDPGKGTTVRVRLPALSPTKAAAAQTASVATDHTGTVAICDDEEKMRDLSRRILIAAGYDVFVIADPRSPFDGLPDRIDLLLTDVVMPDVSGRRLAQELRTRWPQLNVLYMSGYAEGLIRRRGLLVPGVELIRKPFTRAELVERVQTMIDRNG